MVAKGDFEIKGWDEKPAGAAGGPQVTRATVTQKFTGEIKGTGTSEYLMVYRPDKTADYSGVQIIKGSIGTKISPPCMRSSACMTKSTPCCREIQKRVMRISVMGKNSARSAIRLRNSGTTEPREPTTLP